MAVCKTLNAPAAGVFCDGELGPRATLVRGILPNTAGTLLQSFSTCAAVLCWNPSLSATGASKARQLMCCSHLLAGVTVFCRVGGRTEKHELRLSLIRPNNEPHAYLYQQAGHNVPTVAWQRTKDVCSAGRANVTVVGKSTVE